jgi:arylsulfatase A-like enzyme
MRGRRASQPNILVLILDAVRAGNVSGYGYPLETTPRLDAFAAQGILFRRAFAPATWTIPTHASMLSGLYLSQHRIESARYKRNFDDRVVPLPKVLHSAGYRTAAFSQNLLFGPDRWQDGFEEFHEVDAVLDSRPVPRFVQGMARRSKGLRRRVAGYARKVIAPRLLLDDLLDWIEAGDSTVPFFVMANITTAHYAWAPPPGILLRHLGSSPRNLLKQEMTTLRPFAFNSGRRRVTPSHRQMWHSLYDAAIMHADREVGRFLERLRRWSGWQNTIVVVTADHGELLGDYRDIVGHTLSLHDNLLHVPLIIRHPGYTPGLVVEGVVQTLDLYPSALEWAGVLQSGSGVLDVPAAQVQRPALSTAIEAADDPGGYAFAEEDYTDSYDILGGLLEVNPDMDPTTYPRQQIAVRSATHKYIWCDDRPGEFYDLGADPGEHHNLIDSEAEGDRMILAELQEVLQVWRAGLEIFPPRPVSGETDAAVTDRLRALGYVA